jgi:hypothetical protein
MYLDLGCRNTSRLKFEWFKKLINSNSVKEFIDSVFSKYYNIPNLLKSNGFEVNTEKFVFNEFFSNRNASLIIKKDNREFFISIYYPSFEDDCLLSISNKKNWGINDFSDIYGNTYAEFMKYNGDESFKELLDKILSIIDLMDGKVGFHYEDECFNNNKLYKYFSSLSHKVRYNEEINHYLIRFEIPKFVSRDDGNEDFKVSKTSGKELYGILKTSFNDASQWSIGEIAINVVFEVIYDKNVDKDNIIVKTYVYKSDNVTRDVEFESEDKEFDFEDIDCYDLLFRYVKKEIYEENKFNNPNDMKDYINNYLQIIANKFNFKTDFNSNENLW